MLFRSVALAVLAAANAQVLQNDSECRLVTFIPFTDSRPGIPEPHNHNDADYFGYGYGSWPDAETLAKASFSLMASAEMARRHFNDRNPIIVPELASEEMKQCSIQIPSNSLYLDSSYNRERAVDQLLDLWATTIGQAGDQDSMQADHDTVNVVCGVIGPVEPRANEGVSALTESLGVPQIAYATIDRRLDRAADFPTFRRVIPRAEDFAHTVAEYIMRDIWHREAVAILYDASDYGEQFEDPLEDAEDSYCYGSMTEHVVEGDNDSIRSSFEEAEKGGYRTFVLVTDRPSFLNDVARIAEEFGFLGEGFFWVISGDAFPRALQSRAKHEVDSPIDKLLRGAALFTNYDRFIYEGESDPFLQEWRKQDPSLVADLNAMQPRTSEGEAFYNARSTYFEEEVPTEYASFMYDAIMTAGLSACSASLSQQEASSTRNLHLDHIDAINFHGASGPVSFTDEEGQIHTSRNSEGVLFGIYNVRPGVLESNNTRGYELVLTSVYSYDNEYNFELDGCDETSSGNGAWGNVEGTEFLFFDSTPIEPMPKRTVANDHYLSKAIQRVGFALVGVALFICIGSGVWVYIYREHKIVKPGQPEFLYLLCAGASMVASSLLFISFDEDKGKSQSQLDGMCTTVPWFFTLGYVVMYSALHGKLCRLSKLLQIRRRSIKVHQALAPFTCAICSTVVVLIIWTAVDPLQWKNKKIRDEPLEFYGECSSDSFLWFAIPLVVLIATKMGLTAVFAWKLKHLQSELSESRWIFYGIFTHLQLWAIGIPMVIITNDVSKDAVYLMYAALCFTFSTSLVGLVIGPKFFVWFRDTYLAESSSGSQRNGIKIGEVGSTRVSGLSLPHASGSTTILKSTQGGSGSGGSTLMSASTLRRVEELEAEVQELRSKLGKVEQVSTVPTESAPPSKFVEECDA